MDMIDHTTDFDGLHLVLPGNATKEWPEPFCQCWGDQRTTFFRAEDAVMVGTDVGHADIQPSLRDLGNTKLDPGVKTPGYCRLALRANANDDAPNDTPRLT